MQHLADAVPALKQLVLVGGGHSHLFVLAALAMKPILGLRVVLISKDTMTGYSGMLPGYISGDYDFDETHLDLQRLSKYADVTFIQDEIVSLDPDMQKLVCKDRGELSYDWLSINTGSTPTLPIPYEQYSGSAHSIAVKPIAGFLGFIEDLENRLRVNPNISLAVVGGGAAGVEVLLSLRERLSKISDECRFHLVTATKDILPLHNPKVRGMMSDVLKDNDVQIHREFRVSEHIGNTLISDSGKQIEVNEVVFATGARAAEWLKNSGLSLSNNGFIEVSSTLQSLSHQNVFAAGDVAHLRGQATEKAGVFAVRQGKPLAHNIRALIEDKKLKTYSPQKQWLALITTGNKHAIASRGNLALQGKWVWRWKDKIDRRFMAMFQQLQEMPSPETPTLAKGLITDDNHDLVSNLGMRCTGCGSKVGGSVLNAALKRLSKTECEGVEIGLDSPDDGAVINVPDGYRLIQSLDYFSAIVDDPWLHGRIAANHSLGDVYAMGAKPHSVLAMVSLPLGSDAVMGEILEQVLAGANSIFDESGVCIVGGHTTEASELVAGFAVNAFLPPQDIFHKQGFLEGDVIILTKPIGTGVIFAAHNELKAKGEWVEAAIGNMSLSNARGSEVFQEFNATACTDVTGFGLMGHLLEMIKGTEVSISLNLDNIRFLSGALELSKAGIRSTLYPDNVKVRHAIENLEVAHEDPRFPLLFDPQTAGGLIAGVSSADADECIKKLQANSYSAMVIGAAKVEGEGGMVTIHSEVLKAHQPKH